MVSVIASSASVTARGFSARSYLRRSPESLRASESGLNTVGSVGQSARLSTTQRMMVSMWSAQPVDSILSGRIFFQSSGALTA